jgi:hypothetical protein
MGAVPSRSTQSLDRMNPIIATAAVIGSYLLVGSFFLGLGQWLAKRRGVTYRPFTVTVHLLALFAAALGAGLAWMAFASDNPAKWKQLSLPAILIGFVYLIALLQSPPLQASLGRTLRGGKDE